MTESEARVVPLLKATDYLGSEEPTAVRQAAKKLGCLVKVAGLEFVDLDTFEVRVNEAATAKAQSRAARSSKPQTDAQKLGLVKARLARSPELIRKKKAKIEEAENSLRSASNNYETVRAQHALDDLKAQLEKLHTKKAEDEVELDRILNGGETIAEPAV